MPVSLILQIALAVIARRFNTPGIIAHSGASVEYPWYVCSWFCCSTCYRMSASSADSCRTGISDSAVTVLGMFIGAALCHNLGLASSGTAINPETKKVVAGAVIANGKVAVIICIIACFVIAFTNKRKIAAITNK